MNSKEKTILYFLCFTFLIGVAVKLIKQHNQEKNLQDIIVKNNISDSVMPIPGNDDINSNDSDSLININTASNSELEALPGIGPALAQRIINYRQKTSGFKNKEEILKVSGIGPKKFAAIEDKITVK
jgi:comEA protein